MSNLWSFPLGDGRRGIDGRTTKGDPQTSANMRNWMEVSARKTLNASIEAGYSHSPRFA
jgi:hypothetical protein